MGTGARMDDGLFATQSDGLKLLRGWFPVKRITLITLCPNYQTLMGCLLACEGFFDVQQPI